MSQPPKFAELLPTLAAAALLVALLLVQQLAPGQYVTVLQEALHDAAHLPWFALVVLVLGQLAPTRPAWQLLLIAIPLAPGTELLQYLRGRDFGWWDIGRDLIGALVATAVLTWWPAPAGARRPFIRPAALTLALTLVLAAMLPLEKLLARQLLQARAPVLLDAPVWPQSSYLRGNSPWRAAAAPDWPGYREQSVLWVTLSSEPYPNVRVAEPWPDWDGYERLCADLYLSPGPPVRFGVGVGHLRQPGPARSLGFELQPGPNRIELPVAPLLRPREGQGPARIRFLTLYGDAADAGREVAIGRVWLDRIHE